jgi:hypothetical protein
MPHYPDAPLQHYPYPTTPTCYSSICTMATVNRTVTGMKGEKLVLWVLVEQLKGTDRTEWKDIKKGYY